MPLAVKRTAAAGGADATQTSALGVWGVIESLLLAAGWTVHFDYLSGVSGWIPSTVLPPFNSTYGVGAIVSNAGNIYQCIQSGTASTNPTGPTGEGQAIADGTVVWRFITSASGAAKVYTSDGESGNEKLFVRVDANPNNIAGGPAVNVFTYQFFSGGLGYNRFSGAATGSVHHYVYVAGNTVNYAMVADKDSFMVFTNDNANNRRVYGAGRLNRLPSVNATTFVADNAVTAGANKTFTFSSGDPVAAGYKVKDNVFVVSQQTAVASPFVGLIPVYAARITAVTTNSITIDFAQEDTAAGALVGADPQNQFCITSAVNNDPLIHNGFGCCAYVWNPHVTNIWSFGNNDIGFNSQVTGGNGGMLIDTGAAAVDPNNRTGLMTIGEILFMNSVNGEASGIFPKLYCNPRLTDALWAIGRSTRETPSNYDYVNFPANTASPASQRRSLVGPFPISGGSTFNLEVFTINSGRWNPSWLEAEVPETIWPQQDKTTSMFMGNAHVWPFLGDIEINLDENQFEAGKFDIVDNPQIQQTDKVAAIAQVQPTGELTPFDSAEATGGGSGSSGFNSGFN